MELTTAEKFLLLAQHPNKGKLLISNIHIQYGIVGALLLDLSIRNKITIDGDKLIVNNSDEIKDPNLLEILTIIKESPRPRRIRYWVNKFSRKSKKFKSLIVDDMEVKRLIRVEYKKFLGIFPYKKTFLLDTRKRLDLTKQLHNAILHERKLEEENIGILGLVEACKMHKILASDRRELKELRKKLKLFLKDSPIAKVVDNTIKQVQAAIIGAVIAASTVATTSGSN